ncbi:MBL fold metallo-hydrolase, partial [bacterium]|nr:MBL fold metallo-hydrolase [bacterium]
MKVITTVVGSLQTNCYLLIDEETKSAALIDPGDEAEKLLALVKSEGVTLKYILLTHGHRDHTLAVPALKKALPDVPVYIGEADAHSTGIYHYPMADLVPDLKYYGEGDTLPLGSLTIKVLATPGHTLGGVTLLVGDAMFPGDTLFAGSMGRTDLPGGNDAQMLASLRRLAQIEGDYTVYPGHMNSTTLAREKAMNPYRRHALRERTRNHMKLELIGHDEKYALEQSLLTLFPGEKPVYGTVDKTADTRWARVTLTEEDERVQVTTELGMDGKSAAHSYDYPLSGTEYEKEGQRRHAVGISFFGAAKDLLGISPAWGS